jgi:hypothetical protein
MQSQSATNSICTILYRLKKKMPFSKADFAFVQNKKAAACC